jgi:hypothetical protein
MLGATLVKPPLVQFCRACVKCDAPTRSSRRQNGSRLTGSRSPVCVGSQRLEVATRMTWR